MADEEKKEGAEEADAKKAEPAKKSGKSKTMLIIGGVVLLIVVISIPAAMFAFKSNEVLEGELSPGVLHEDDSLVPEGSLDEDELSEEEEALGAIFPLETFVVNLNGGRLMRCQMQLEFAEKEVPKRFYLRIVPIRDIIISMLAKKSADDLLTDKGKEALKSDIKSVINEMLKKEDIRQVYFTQFLVQ